MRGIAATTGRLRSAVGLAYAALTHTGTSRLTAAHAAAAGPNGRRSWTVAVASNCSSLAKTSVALLSRTQGFATPARAS